MADSTVTLIPPLKLALGFVPVAAIALVMWHWSVGARTVLWASARMLLQLALIGYVLTWIFTAGDVRIVALVLTVMLTAASFIALRPLGHRSTRTWWHAFTAIASGGLVSLLLTVGGVLTPAALLEARVVIPLAGMIFASAMNAVSLAAERFAVETTRGIDVAAARREALNAAMIPLLNSFFAVGLVTLPGMMTGQILSGVDPAVATRYQVMVMCMTFSAAGLAAIVYLLLAGAEASNMNGNTDASDRHRDKV